MKTIWCHDKRIATKSKTNAPETFHMLGWMVRLLSEVMQSQKSAICFIWEYKISSACSNVDNIEPQTQLRCCLSHSHHLDKLDAISHSYCYLKMFEFNFGYDIKRSDTMWPMYFVIAWDLQHFLRTENSEQSRIPFNFDFIESVNASGLCGFSDCDCNFLATGFIEIQFFKDYFSKKGNTKNLTKQRLQILKKDNKKISRS